MHIPSSMLHGRICPVTAAVCTAGIATALYFGFRSKIKPTAARFGAITALIFAAQMLNFPIMNGTSGHLLGGVLASILLGTPFGVLAVALVITIQTLVFSDGGLAVLGANILNMAIIGAGAGGIIYTLITRLTKTKPGKYAAVAAASWISVVLAACAVSAELALDGQITFTRVFPAMVGTHALIGIGEAVITSVCFFLFPVPAAGQKTKEVIIAPLTAAFIAGALLSPFASLFPDGLERVTEKYSILHQSAPAFVSPFQGYTIPWVNNRILSTGAAGLAGVIIAFCTAWILVQLLNFYMSKRTTA